MLSCRFYDGMKGERQIANDFLCLIGNLLPLSLLSSKGGHVRGQKPERKPNFSIDVFPYKVHTSLKTVICIYFLFCSYVPFSFLLENNKSRLARELSYDTAEHLPTTELEKKEIVNNVRI